ncbi:MAG: O-antigen ligase family protein [Pseudomonadota bacterium]
MWLVSLWILWIPVPLGSNRPWAEAILVAMANLALFVWLIETQLQRQPIAALRESKILRWLCVWLTWTGLQIVPMPLSWLEVISPFAAHTWEIAGKTDFGTISIDPYRSASRWWLTEAFVTIVWVVLESGQSSHVRRWLLGCLALSASLQAFGGSLMLLAGESLVWFGETLSTGARASGTYPSPDHFAGLMILGGAASFGMLVTGPRIAWGSRPVIWVRNAIDWLLSPKATVRVMLGVIVIGVVLSRSRLGVTAFFSALVITAVLLLVVARLRQHKGSWRLVALLVSILVFDIWVVSNWFGLEKVVERLEQTQLQEDARAEVLPAYPPAIERYFWVGSGLGTFEFSFPPFRPAHVGGAFRHAHNDYAQFAIETGLIGCLILMGIVITTTRRTWRLLVDSHSKSAKAVAVAWFYALAGLALHSVGDFNLQIPANAGLFMILIGLANACHLRSNRPEARSFAHSATDG